MYEDIIPTTTVENEYEMEDYEIFSLLGKRSAPDYTQPNTTPERNQSITYKVIDKINSTNHLPFVSINIYFMKDLLFSALR